MPDSYGIEPTIFFVASSMIQNLSGKVPMISCPVPALVSSAARRTLAGAMVIRNRAASSRPTACRVTDMHSLLWKYQVDFAPVFLGGGAAARPAGRVIQLIGHLRWPVTSDVAVEEIAFDGLAQSGRAARAIYFPSGREHGRASERNVRRRLLGRLPALQCDDVLLRGFQLLVDLRCLPVDSFQVRHQCLLRTPAPGLRRDRTG